MCDPRIEYLFIITSNYNTITNSILIIYKLSNFDLELGLKSQTRASAENRIHHPHANSLAYYSLDYQGTQTRIE